jgi:hypothetical protein
MAKHAFNLIFRLPLWSHLTVTGNFNIKMMLKILFLKNKSADGLLKDIEELHMGVRKSYNSPINKSYAGYTVLPGIAIPFSSLLVSSPSFNAVE